MILAELIGSNEEKEEGEKGEIETNEWNDDSISSLISVRCTY